MASVPSLLRVVGAHDVGPSTRVLEIERVDGAPFRAISGKYIIVDTGVMLEGGKRAKRAYSLIPVAGREQRCRLAIKRIGSGPGSNAMHAAPVGTELSFSGPWGKLVPAEGLTERTLFVATDTGITSALGVVEQAHARASYADEADEAKRAGRSSLEVLWLRAEDETFLDVAQVQARIEAAGARFVHALLPPVGSRDRAFLAWRHVDARLAEVAPRVLLGAGDGLIVHPLRERFLAEAQGQGGVSEVRIECFFHNPERKAG